MDYKKMWEELKNQIVSKKSYHESGLMQSTFESIQKEACCKEILEMMSQIEDQEKSAK